MTPRGPSGVGFRRVRIEITPQSREQPDSVTVFLTVEEADLLRQSLQLWADSERAGKIDPGWHTHLDRDPEAPELTIAVVR